MSSNVQMAAIEVQLDDIENIENFLHVRSREQINHLQGTVEYVINHLSNIRIELRNRIERLVSSVETEVYGRRRIILDNDFDDDNNVQENQQYEQLEAQEDEPIVLLPIVPPKIKTRALKRSDQVKLMDDVCSICYDTHLLLECFTTTCGHHFGRNCIHDWISSTMEQGVESSCPLCKAHIAELTGYRPRKVPTASSK
jgi:hypothetical protein